MPDVQHLTTPRGGAFVVEEEGTRLAEMVYLRSSPTLAIIEHTEVDDRLRGQGAGLALLEALTAWARAEGVAVIPLCPFAKATYAKHPELQDVLRR